jgi:hypothetical protein
MPFSKQTLREAWRMVRRHCECQRDGHGHHGRCEEPLKWEYRGLIGPGGWEARPWTPFEEGGADDPENCEIVCWRCLQAEGTGERE